ncbi:unnamed protein product [Hyaloperonospora brassicae]|uniref:PX domain-containing protein n=1 Tax=Hyaloperonospora brassicae TaxID=162125 RepID=A0AAV0TWQ6_HYABA|nr:unnamed protein product [Hyaloperonospora brassicae]
MARAVVGVDVTAHKEARNVADVGRKVKLWVRYYVEIVVGSPRESHTRLGFSGSFRTLSRMHREFVRLYDAKHVHPHSGKMKKSCVSSSMTSSTLRSSASSTLMGSPTPLSGLMRHALGLKKEESISEDVIAGAGVDNRILYGSRTCYPHQGCLTALDPSGIAPFPSDNTMLTGLESLEAKDDVKIEARSTALFEYYSHLFNSDDRDLYLDFAYQSALEHVNKKNGQVSGDHSGDRAKQIPSTNVGMYLKLLFRPVKDGAKTSQHVEFREPVYVRVKIGSHRRPSTRKH